ncbi:MAG: diguanylate cyclase domain-containing protein [Niveispirillum sp.]|uniref:diguanylate cyclase domain-containing protein n=1 Tax=Niveispirillum sp. TaxID=1917217 RepID=UPI003BA41AE4
MEAPDIGTLRLCLGFAGLLSLLVMAALWQARGRVPGTGSWLVAAIMSALAYLLPPAVQWPRPDLGIAINCSLTLSAMLFMLEGSLALRGFGDAARRRLPVVSLCLAILALMLISAGRPWLRVALHDGLAFLLLTATALTLVWRAPRWSWLPAGGMAMLFVALGLLLLWRGLGLLATGMDLGGADTRMPPWLLAATLAWTLGWTSLFPALVAATEGESLRQQAERDTLTGLASRTAFLRLAGVGADRQHGLLLLALEGLRTLNSSLGHGTGDRMLAAFAVRLREAAGPGTLAGRLTGAQFALLLPGLSDRADLLAAADRLRTALSVPLVIGDLVQIPEFTLGAALAPEDGKSVERLLEAAERAMFRVRAAQRTG